MPIYIYSELEKDCPFTYKIDVDFLMPLRKERKNKIQEILTVFVFVWRALIHDSPTAILPNSSLYML